MEFTDVTGDEVQMILYREMAGIQPGVALMAGPRVQYQRRTTGPMAVVRKSHIAATIGTLLAVLGSAPDAQELASSRPDTASLAARRFPQPVRVGDLIHRDVIEPRESRILLGHVVRVVRLAQRTEAIVMSYGGVLGFGGREIAVPTDAMVLLGEELEVLAYTPEQLEQFPTYRPDGHDSVTLRPDDVIRMGLARPSH